MIKSGKLINKPRRIKAKTKGSVRERQIKKILIDNGALEVAKSGGSLGKFDLIALFPYRVMCVQVKSNQFPKDEEEWNLAKSVDSMDKHLYLPCCIVIRDAKFDGPKFAVRVYLGTKKIGSVRKIKAYDAEYNSLKTLIKNEMYCAYPRLEAKPLTGGVDANEKAKDENQNQES